MLNNKADAVEKYILKMLSENEGREVVLKRTALADEVSCAPSQVSYVLSTRFTNSRGFKVESQRGLGGYIRITIIEDKEDEKKLFYRDIHRILMSDEEIVFEDVKKLLTQLVKEKIITLREAEIVAQSALRLYEFEKVGVIDPQIRKILVDAMFDTLSKIS